MVFAARPGSLRTCTAISRRLHQCAGWKEGRRRLTPRPANRFERKWLLVRFNALRRNRQVDESLTPQLLERITPERCPILTVPMTCGTGGDLDASVDRVHSSGAYAMGNICVMSVRANLAKGAKDLSEVWQTAVRLAKEGGEQGGLDATHWARLAALMVGPHWLATGQDVCLPQCTFLPVALAASGTQILQDVVLSEALGLGRGHVLGRLRALSGGAGERRLHRLVQAIRHKARRHRWPFDVWLERGVFQRYLEWLDSLEHERAHAMLATIADRDRTWRTEFTLQQVRQSWSLDTSGYALQPA